MPRHLTVPRQLAIPSLPRRWTSRKTLKRILILAAASLVLQPLLTYRPLHQHVDLIDTEHPVDHRIATAAERWRKKIFSQSSTYDQFKTEYARRYELDPPPGMETWFTLVKADGHLLVDEYDDMMKSLEPFRLMGGDEVLRRTLELAHLPTFSLLNITHHRSWFSGTNYHTGERLDSDNVGQGVERVQGLDELLQRYIEHIPDGVLMAVSELAEPRVIVPWQDHPTTLAQLSSVLDSPSSAQIASVEQMMSSLKRPNISALLPTPNFRDDGSSWEIYTKSCPPESPARKLHTSMKGASSPRLQTSAGPALAKRRSWVATTADFGGTNESTVSNLTKRELEAGSFPQSVEPTTLSTGNVAKDSMSLYNSSAFSFVSNGWKGPTHETLCNDTALHEIQGAFYSDWRSLGALYPVFSPSKIDGFADIIIPSNYYYGTKSRYTFNASNAVEWSRKESKLFWRGGTTGGGNCPPRHQHLYQRHRFVKLVQSFPRSLQSLLVRTSGVKLDEVPPLLHVKLPSGELNSNWIDVGFTSYVGCGEQDICAATRKMFPLKNHVKFSDMSNYKGILDLDGMAFSGRFVGLMAMGSVVFKSTIYRDFASDWLEPWWHFVPLSLTYDELYNLLAFFFPLPEDSAKKLGTFTASYFRPVGKTKQSPGDAALESIAKAAGQWSELVAKKVNAEAYVFRLALEWSRILENKVEVTPRDEDVDNYDGGKTKAAL